jgi:hypothetical protein
MPTIETTATTTEHDNERGAPATTENGRRVWIPGRVVARHVGARGVCPAGAVWRIEAKPAGRALGVLGFALVATRIV